MGLAESALLSQDAVFRGKVKVAMIKKALAIKPENDSGMQRPKWFKRNALAQRVIDDVEGCLEKFVFGIVADLNIVTASPDSAIATRIDTVYNELAGIVFDEVT